MKTERSDRLRIIAALVNYGHSASKALEIALDAERRDAHAIAWVNKALDHQWSRQMGSTQ